MQRFIQPLCAQSRNGRNAVKVLQANRQQTTGVHVSDKSVRNRQHADLVVLEFRVAAINFKEFGSACDLNGLLLNAKYSSQQSDFGASNL